jgi:DNA-binding LacI/PurR family transcriptional regulator
MECNRAGLQLVLLMGPTPEELDRVRRFLRSGAVDAALLISEHWAGQVQPALLLDASIPFVIGGRPMQPGLDVPYVDNDNVMGGRLAARHLTEIGRRVIGTVAGPRDMSAGIDRLDGFRSELGSRYLASRVEHGDFTRQGGQAAAERLLARAPDLDALFAASDLMAVGALDALRRAGRRVPEDVAVVGFDDNEFAASTDPPLTTIRQLPVVQGREMVRMYLSQHRPDIPIPVDEAIPDVREVDRIILPVSLVVRGSA